jgi:hypothetical protein
LLKLLLFLLLGCCTVFFLLSSPSSVRRTVTCLVVLFLNKILQWGFLCCIYGSKKKLSIYCSNDRIMIWIDAICSFFHTQLSWNEAWYDDFYVVYQ